MSIALAYENLDSEVQSLLNNWGFASTANQQLITHAKNVIACEGMKAGEIVVYFNLATQSVVEGHLSTCVDGERALQYLSRYIPAIGPRIDEFLCVQGGLPYLSKLNDGLFIHPQIAGDSMKQLESQMTQLDFVPLISGHEIVLLFAGAENLFSFASMGKEARLRSQVHSVFGFSEADRRKKSFFRLAVAERSVYNAYRQQLQDNSTNTGAEDTSIQRILHTESTADPVINQVVRILEQAISDKVNDVAIVPDRTTGRGVVKFRKNQRLFNSGLFLTPEDREAVSRVLQTRSRANPDNAELRRPVDGSVDYEGKNGVSAFLRLNFIPLESSVFPGTSISIRILPKSVKSIDLSTLNIPDDLQDELRFYSTRKQGLFLVAGPTGSGKSTTIGGMMCANYNEYGEELKRIAVENPCERILPGTLHVDVSQYHFPEKEGAVVNRFEKALRAIVRHDPDVVFVGEVRDRESCEVSVAAANTGHMVFTTTHANSPVMAYRRLSSFLDQEQRYDLVNVLIGILCQRLCAVLCPVCSEEHEMTEHLREDLYRYAESIGIEKDAMAVPEKHRVANKDGCDGCTNGYSHMIPIHGLLKVTPPVRKLLLSGNPNDLMVADQMADQRFTLFGSTMRLFSEGRIEAGEVML